MDSWPSKRRHVIGAFWATILLGVPLWYFTTQVSRAPLPAIPVFPAIRPVISIKVDGIEAFSSHMLTTGLNLMQNTHRFSNDTSILNGYTIDWRESSSFSSQILPGTRQWNVRSSASQSQNLEESLMSYTLAILKDERHRIESILTPHIKAPDLRVVKYNPGYDLVFSLLNGAGSLPSATWNMQNSLTSIMGPILTDIAAVGDFSIESQVQYYADLTFDPVFDPDTKEYILQKSDLKNFMNSAEWNLATAQGSSKPLNFIIYVPRPEHRPLVIREGDLPVATNSFLLPQFGSILIHNPQSQANSDIPDNSSLDEIIHIFSKHFLTLMGMPSVPYAFGDASKWRIDGLIRQRLVETMLSAQQTLKSIPKVVNQIPNMHVPRRVAILISEGIAALNSAQQCLEKGDIEVALQHSRLAVQHAEEAFFDDKMVSLLYFPDEHKYGVYMPLFGPLLLPLVMAGIRELKVFLVKWRASRSSPSRRA